MAFIAWVNILLRRLIPEQLRTNMLLHEEFFEELPGAGLLGIGKQ